MERRLAAIVIADVVGYSKLTHADEEGTPARFRTLQEELLGPSVTAHGGRVIKTMGDAYRQVRDRLDLAWQDGG